MRAIRDRLTYANVMSTLAVFLALGGGAFAVTASDEADPGREAGAETAQIPTRGGTIIGCYNRRTGALRVVRSSRRCRRGRERVLRWAQRGRTGQPGTPADTSAFYTKGETDGRFLPVNGTALNAARLEGLAALAFEPTETLTFGKGSQTAVPAVSVLEVPKIGFRLLTDGDAANDNQMRIQSTRSSGTISLGDGGGGPVLNPGETSPEEDPNGFSAGPTQVWRQLVTNDTTGAFALVECWMDQTTAQCVARTS